MDVGTNRKAFEINLDRQKYGTFAEIGAGQEVARRFFHVGGASGTIAKTMSAYDMTFSDAIYGPSDRYVSRVRLNNGGITGKVQLIGGSLDAAVVSGGIRMLHLAMRADRKNFLDAQEELKQRGIKFEFEDHQISHSIYFSDPDGHHLEITTHELK